MKRRGASLVRRMVVDLLFFKVTHQGWVVTAAILATALTGLLTFLLPIYHLFVALLCFFTVASFAGLLFWPRCIVKGEPPEKLVAGRATTVQFHLTNRSRLSAYDLSIGFFGLPPSIRELHAGKTVPRLAGGETVTIPVELEPLRRGQAEFDGPRHFSTVPFNVFRSGSRPKGSCAVTVLPAFHPISLAGLPIRSRYQPGGVLFTSNVGESCEYISNREYRPGDSMRRIDYRSWARLAAPVVREYQEEYYCRVALVLDTYVARGRVKGRLGFPQLEAAVSLAASVAEAISHGEYLLDIFAAGPELYVFRSGRHTTHLDNVLEILACVEECRRNPFAVVAPALAGELGNISTVIFVLLDWDEDRRNLVRLAAESGCATKVIVIRRGPTTLPVADDEITVLTPQQVQNGEVVL